MDQWEGKQRFKNCVEAIFARVVEQILREFRVGRHGLEDAHETGECGVGPGGVEQFGVVGQPESGPGAGEGHEGHGVVGGVATA